MNMSIDENNPYLNNRLPDVAAWTDKGLLMILVDWKYAERSYDKSKKTKLYVQLASDHFQTVLAYEISIHEDCLGKILY